MIEAVYGQQVGGNLFHSFSQFNLTSTESASFRGPSSVQNILARVTGGSASQIDGLIRSEIPGANLFLLNPSGVMFGPNAKIDLSGALTVSTANYLLLADGGKFNSSIGGNDVLTSAAVSAFGFLSTTPSAVSFNQTQLTTQPGKDLTVIAGDISLTGANLNASGGHVSLFSAGSTGEISFDPAVPSSEFFNSTVTKFGALSVSKSSTVQTADQGKIVLRGGKLTVLNSKIAQNNTTTSPGGGISIEADSATVSNGATINSTTSSLGASGDIQLHTGSFELSNDGGIYSTSIGHGKAGDIFVTSDNITMQGSDPAGVKTGIFGFSLSAPGGNIQVSANNLLSISNVGLYGADISISGANGTISGVKLYSSTNQVSLSVGGVPIDNPGTGSDGGSSITSVNAGTGATSSGGVSVEFSLSVPVFSYSLFVTGALPFLIAPMPPDPSALTAVTANEGEFQALNGKMVLNSVGTSDSLTFSVDPQLKIKGAPVRLKHSKREH